MAPVRDCMRRPRRLQKLGRQIQRWSALCLFALAYAVSVMGVPVPPVLVEQVEEVEQTSSAVPHDCCCCSKGRCSAQTCCCAPSSPSEDDQQPTSTGPTVVAKSKGKSWGLAFKARECQGLDTEWVSGGGSLPPPSPVYWSFEWNLVGWLDTCLDCPVAISFLPAEPPPRLSSLPS